MACKSPPGINATGPQATFTGPPHAAMQLPQTGHLCVAQQFQIGNDRSAEMLLKKSGEAFGWRDECALPVRLFTPALA